MPTHLLSLCALLASICATAITQPADVLRSNRQLSATIKNPVSLNWRIEENINICSYRIAILTDGFH